MIEKCLLPISPTILWVTNLVLNLMAVVPIILTL